MTTQKNNKEDMRQSFRLVLAVVVSVSISIFYFEYREQPLKDYSLQEKCAKDAQAFFELVQPRMLFPHDAGFLNHYNSGLNKCFVQIDESPFESLTETLYDAVEKKQYGRAETGKGATFNCSMLGAQCHSSSEWLVLLKKYMEEN